MISVNDRGRVLGSMEGKARALFNDHNILRKLKIVLLVHILVVSARVFDGH